MPQTPLQARACGNSLLPPPTFIFKPSTPKPIENPEHIIIIVVLLSYILDFIKFIPIRFID